VRLGADGEQPDALWFYRQVLEQTVLQHTREFYVYYANDYMSSHSISDYLCKVEQILEFERTFSNQLLHPSTTPELLRVCRDALLKLHMPTLQTEVKSMLLESRKTDLKRLFSLLQHLPSRLRQLADAFCSWVSSIAMIVIRNQAAMLHTHTPMKDAVRPQRADSLGASLTHSLGASLVALQISLVHTLLALCKQAQIIVQTCFDNHPQFLAKFDEACEHFINVDVGTFKMPELLAMFCDHVLIGKERVSDDTALVRRMDSKAGAHML